jgi:hypothetical protein
MRLSCHESTRSVPSSTFTPRLRTLVLSILICAWGSAIQAAPVTFGFEAEVVRLSGIPNDTGIEFAVGDVIFGRFTFEPSAGDDPEIFGDPQLHEFVLDINGSVLVAPSFHIVAENNLDRSIDGPGTDFVDSLDVTWSLSTVDDLGSTNFDRVGFIMSLWEPTSNSPDQTDVLDSTSIPAEAVIWNRFHRRRIISVGFSDGKGGSTNFFAEVAEFRVIPEPATCCLVFFLLATFAMVRPGRFRRP